MCNNIENFYNKHFKEPSQIDEEFKVVTYPGIVNDMYVISNYGNVYNTLTMHKMSEFIDKDGYKRVQLKSRRKDVHKNHVNVSIHRLVAYEFCTNACNVNIVNHIDGNKQNNYYKNLEWVTAKENTNHAIKTGLQINSGPHCPSAIYSEEVVRGICDLMERGYDNNYIYHYYNTNDKHITDKAFYALIFTIRNKTRHKIISDEYNIPSNKSVSRPKFTEDEVNQIRKLINEGWRPIEIAKYYGAKNSHDEIGRRVMDKIRYIKNTII